MTKYILNSGGLKNEKDRAKSYFSELLDGCGSQPKILWCFFAEFPEPSIERFEIYTKLFGPQFPEGVKPQHRDATVKNFQEEVKWADVIYIHGGNVATLATQLDQYNLEQMFTGKTIGCNSASSMYMSRHYWSCDSRKCGDGMGIFPIKFIAHYNSSFGDNKKDGVIDWDEAYEELKSYGNTSLPIHALEEGEFIVSYT